MYRALVLMAVALVLSLHPGDAHAGVSGWSPPTSVVKIYGGDTTLLVFGHMFSVGCASGAYVRLDTSTQSGKDAMQLILAASLSGRNVRYRVVSPCGAENYYTLLFSVELL